MDGVQGAGTSVRRHPHLHSMSLRFRIGLKYRRMEYLKDCERRFLIWLLLHISELPFFGQAIVMSRFDYCMHAVTSDIVWVDKLSVLKEY